MNRKENLPAIILLLISSFLLVILLFFLSISTYKHINSVCSELDAPSQFISDNLTQFTETQQFISGQVSLYEANLYNQQISSNQENNGRERAAVYEAPAGPSIFSMEDQSIFSDTPDASISVSESSNGHIICIDPGHQDYSVDMSAAEPIGPGSSEMKAKSTSGTSGSFTFIPEYQLNLDISLLLKEALEKNGYTVIMTRTDNQTAISNKERAELASNMGAEIFVRIHANGSEDASVSGALTMCPSPDNPFVAELSSESERLAKDIINSYCEATGFSNQGVHYYDNMSGINWSTVPVTILEMGYMTNESDDLKMNDPSVRSSMVQGIVNGINHYFNIQ